MTKKPSRLNRFFYEHRNKGIPNLMLYISLGSAVVYFMTMMAGNTALYELLCFDYHKILSGQVWRLITYVFTYQTTDQNVLLVLISLVCFYSLGSAIERAWGTLRFTLFYCTGIVLMDIFAMVCGGIPVKFMGISYDVSSIYTSMIYYLNLSLLIAFATLYPDAHFLFMFIIPVKAWIFGLLYLALSLYDVYDLMVLHPLAPLLPHSLFPLVALANYFLFFGKGVANLFPISWRIWASRLFRKKSAPVKKAAPIPFPGATQPARPAAQPAYTHRCTICGRTDVSNPELEFRYCSRCKGYFCYCQDHISNHTHVE